MDPETARTSLPRYWRGVRRNHVGVQKGFELCAFDTETFFGRVFALGFSDGRGRFSISYGLGKDHVSFLLACLFSVPGRGKRSVVCGAHFLVFDLGVLFYETLNPKGSTAPRAPRRSHFSHLKTRTEIEIFWGKPCFAKFRRSGHTIHLLDTFAFFTMGLGRALAMIGGSAEKLSKPSELGKRLIPLPELRPYLKADCLGVLELLKEIQRLHEKYETRLCVSLPQLSSRIFRHFYLRRDFALTPKPAIIAGLLSYHGGKNSFVGSVGWHSDCWDLDINSAYPEAMAQLPDFEHGKWRSGRGIAFFRRNPHGLYRVSGNLRTCPYGVIQTHDFKKAEGKISGIWTTGYEVAEALRSGELRIHGISGFGFHSRGKMGLGKGSRQGSSFARFVADFYRLKREAKSKTEAYFYKLILNSLYGKFIQRTEDEDGNMVAGSMFDPTIASLITGYVRAKIHRLEHKYQAIHTATDGFITKVRPLPEDLGDEIGKLKSELFGPVLILRNKLYLHFDKAGKLGKSGLHGFEGDPEELQRVWKSSRRIYHVTRLVKWAESWHLGVPPGTELRVKKMLNIGGAK